MENNSALVRGLVDISTLLADHEEYEDWIAYTLQECIDILEGVK